MDKKPLRYHYYRPTRTSVAAPTYRHSPGSGRKLLLFTTFVTFATVGVLFLFGNLVPAIVKSEPPTTPHYSQSALAASIHTILKNSDAQIGVALEDMQTGQLMTYGQTTPFVAASTAKVIAACAYYHLVETGKASLDTPLGSYDAQFQLKAMINISDNDAWQLLTGVIGIDELSAYAAAIGIHYDTNTNTMSAADMATLLTKLYSGKLLNQADTQQLLSYMQFTNNENLIPAVTSADINVYHKYGLLDGNLHDAAILVKGSQSFSLVIYTKSSDDSDDDARTDIIHQITNAVTSAVFS